MRSHDSLVSDHARRSGSKHRLSVLRHGLQRPSETTTHRGHSRLAHWYPSTGESNRNSPDVALFGTVNSFRRHKRATCL